MVMEGRKDSEAYVKTQMGGFPGGLMVKEAPANAGDTGPIPGGGRVHMSQSHSARAPQLLGLCSREWELQLLSPHSATTEACTP